MAIFAGGFGNWVSDKYHKVVHYFDDSHQGKSPIEKAIDNELKAVLQNWKTSPPTTHPMDSSNLTNTAKNNIAKKITQSTTLSTRDKALLSAIDVTATGALSKAAESMFTKFEVIVGNSTSKGIAKELNNPTTKPPLTLGNLLLTTTWDNNTKSFLTNTANQSKTSADAWYTQQPQAQAQPTLPQLQDRLLNEFATERNRQPQNATRMGEIRNQIHAVAYAIAEEETKTTQQPIHKLFASNLEKLRANKQLDHVPSDISSLTKEKIYDTLEFMNTAIIAEQKNNPHDAKNAPNLLESINAQLETIAEKVEALQKKAAAATNPIEQQALENEAHDLLRLHGELGTLLNSQYNRELLQASMSKADFAQLRDYLTVLEAQQQMLINMVGKNKPRFTPIPLPMLVDADNDRTAAIAKKGNLYGGISFKVKNRETGAWEPSVLESKGKAVTGLSRTEILAAIEEAAKQLRKTLNDPNYTIKVTEDSDGTIHYDAGNAKNREVLHNQFKAVFDSKEEAKAADAVTPTTAASSLSHVTHQTANLTRASYSLSTSQQQQLEQQQLEQQQQGTAAAPSSPSSRQRPNGGPQV